VEVHTTPQRPLFRKDQLAALEETGFREIETFGVMALPPEPFDPERSGDLVVTAGAPEAGYESEGHLARTTGLLRQAWTALFAFLEVSVDVPGQSCQEDEGDGDVEGAHRIAQGLPVGAQVVAAQRQQAAPDERAGESERDKAREVHLRHAGRKEMKVRTMGSSLETKAAQSPQRANQ